MGYIKSRWFTGSADLLVGSLVCKATGASWSYDYIRRHSIVAELSVRCRVPERELLIALKIRSGRRADLRDIVYFC